MGVCGENHHNWKGGRYKDKDGYDLVYCLNHPRSHKNMVREHIFIAEKALGKPLPPEAKVHHHDPKQLVICQDQAYHLLLHQRMRAYVACGHANWRKCWICKQHDDPEKLSFSGDQIYHRSCATERTNKRRHRD